MYIYNILSIFEKNNYEHRLLRVFTLLVTSYIKDAIDLH
jgi:hypothetical protein